MKGHEEKILLTCTRACAQYTHLLVVQFVARHPSHIATCAFTCFVGFIGVFGLGVVCSPFSLLPLCEFRLGFRLLGLLFPSLLLLFEHYLDFLNLRSGCLPLIQTKTRLSQCWRRFLTFSSFARRKYSVSCSFERRNCSFSCFEESRDANVLSRASKRKEGHPVALKTPVRSQSRRRSPLSCCHRQHLCQ